MSRPTCFTARCWRSALEHSHLCADCTAAEARAERAARVAAERAALERDQLSLFGDTH